MVITASIRSQKMHGGGLAHGVYGFTRGLYEY
jgi:hypothetical protein